MPSRPASRVSAAAGIRSGHIQRTGRGLMSLASVTITSLPVRGRCPLLAALSMSPPAGPPSLS